MGYIALLSEAPLEGGRDPDELCLPAQQMYTYVSGIREPEAHLPVPLLLPAIPVPPPNSSRRPSELPSGWRKGPPWPQALGSPLTGSRESC